MEISSARIFLALSLSTAISFRGYLKSSLALDGAITSFFVGMLLTITNYCFCATVIIFFLFGSKLTRFKAQQKLLQDSEYHIGGRRDWKQVLCTGGLPCFFALLYLIQFGSLESEIVLEDATDYHSSSFISLCFLGSISCACADTFASEIGSVSGGKTCKLITTFKVVPVGTNGGVSMIGFFASLLGGLLMGLTYNIALCTSTGSYIPNNSVLLLTGSVSGLFGSILDSYLGATMQYSGFDMKTKKIVNHPNENAKHISGNNILSNHSVNLLSAIITAIFTPKLHALCCALFAL